MAYSQSDSDNLKAAIAQGALRVRFGDRDVTYRSLDEMRQTLTLMQTEVNGVSGRVPTRQIRFVTSKGL
jgi:hypothetical protein